MPLDSLNLQQEYRTKVTDVSKRFIVPILSQAVVYKRAVGFFSSSCLLEISKGIGALAKNGGKIFLVASPRLSEEDVEAINEGYKSRDETIKKALTRELPNQEELSSDDRARLNLLANLIAIGMLDIKIAFIDDGSGFGIYHEKLGLVEDRDGNTVAFTGSMNETKSALVSNYEAIDVYCSWKSEDATRVQNKETAFDAIWNNIEPGITTRTFPEVSALIQKKYLVDKPNLDIDADFESAKNIDIVNAGQTRLKPGICGQPTQPENLEVRDYQKEAVESWSENGYIGLFDMATGTGKTITSLLGLVDLYEHCDGSLIAIITCPYQHLVEQWVGDLSWFGVKPIIAYSSSKQRDWKKRLKKAIFNHKIGVPRASFVCCITTNATLATDSMQEILRGISGNALIIADEAHNLGAPGYQKTLTGIYNYRLGLSATIDRHHDPDGTAFLMHYFSKICIEYPLDKAIREGKLTRYIYHPVICVLTNDELAEYRRLTKELGKKMAFGKKHDRMPKSAEIIAQQRSRVIAGAKDKLQKLLTAIKPYRDDKYILVYCGATKVLDYGFDTTGVDDSDERQITRVVSMLGNDLNMSVSKFTSEEDIDERDTLKGQFAKGNLQALVAIKCLDEGVDIPNIRTAFILASTTNPKEYIQRRGRLLRLAKGKKYAEIYDFVTLPYSINDASGMTTEELRTVFTLVSNETERAFEFARFAENFAEAEGMIDEISEAFRLDEIRTIIEHEKHGSR